MTDVSSAVAAADAVDWSALRTAEGAATAVPTALRGLAGATTAAESDHWYWKLDNHVVLQGSIYTAAYQVIPVMQALINSDRVASVRARAYDLLVEIARGEVGDRDHGSVTASDGQSYPLDQACRDRILQARDRYIADLRGDEPLIRRKALDLIVSFDDETGELRSLLKSVDPGDDDAFRDAINDELSDLD